MSLSVDQTAVSRHIRHLSASFKTTNLPWEMANIAAVEALHIVASKHDRKWAAGLFRALADRYEKLGSGESPSAQAPAQKPNGKIDPDRLERAEWYAEALFANDPSSLALGRNPPTDPRIISCLDMLGRGWADGQRLMLGDTDITAELRVLFDEIDRLNDLRDEGEEEPDIDREAVRVVGAKLNRMGGVDAMRAAAEALRPMVGSKVSRLNWEWDGIGNWRW
jgi:hypothetical protein